MGKLTPPCFSTSRNKGEFLLEIIVIMWGIMNIPVCKKPPLQWFFTGLFKQKAREENKRKTACSRLQIQVLPSAGLDLDPGQVLVGPPKERVTFQNPFHPWSSSNKSLEFGATPRNHCRTAPKTGPQPLQGRCAPSNGMVVLCCALKRLDRGSTLPKFWFFDLFLPIRSGFLHQC